MVYSPYKPLPFKSLVYSKCYVKKKKMHGNKRKTFERCVPALISSLFVYLESYQLFLGF
jgi:hypothetical protein